MADITKDFKMLQTSEIYFRLPDDFDGDWLNGMALMVEYIKTHKEYYDDHEDEPDAKEGFDLFISMYPHPDGQKYAGGAAISTYHVEDGYWTQDMSMHAVADAVAAFSPLCGVDGYGKNY